MGLSFSTNIDPSAFLLRVRNRATPRTEDLEFAVEEQKTRILTRTAAGQDYEGRSFAPYSEKGPYYYYPNGRSNSTRGKGVATRSLIAAKRFHAKINAGRGTPIGEVTPGGGIKFRSYAEFKRALGRTNVDLLGPKAPHMLQSIVKTTTGLLEVRLGIYDAEKAAIATGHNNGTGRLPQRKFFAISESDKSLIKGRLLNLLQERAA